MQRVGNTDIIGTARELHKHQRTDIAFAVSLAAEQGGFERMLGAEQPERAEKPAARPREETAPEPRQAVAEGRHAPVETREDARVPVAREPRTEEPREPAAEVRRPAAGPQQQITRESLPRPAAALLPRSSSAGETMPRPLPAPPEQAAVKPDAATADTKPAPAPAVPTRDAGYARLVGQQALLHPAAAKPLRTDGQPAPAPPATDLPAIPHPAQESANPLHATEAPELGPAGAVVEQGANETAAPPPPQPAATVAFNPLPPATAQPSPVATLAAAEAPLPDQTTPEASAQLSQQVRAQVLTQLTGQLGGPGGKGSLRLSLSPPELGRVEIRFTRDAGRLQLTFRVESAVAARALQDGSGQLQELLLGHKSNWQHVEIAVEREGEDTEKKNPSEQRGRSRRDDERREAPDREDQGGEA